ncbi:hypothetical protein [Rhodococcus sp. AG1013]|uniref:hypothetical protein n=1 Tax=Rhodococcus sp. AG1013 TaxID=2183996 RepID=UPI0011C02E5C|nr:hypothetical protein [Rhodococcus sp. AG1013]
MEATRAQAWVDAVSDGASLRALASVLEINHVTVRRRIEGKDASLAVDIARHYGADPIEGLIAFGVITGDEAKRGGVQFALTEASDLQLAEEMVRRIKAGVRVYNAPLVVPDDEPKTAPGPSSSPKHASGGFAAGLVAAGKAATSSKHGEEKVRTEAEDLMPK